MDNDVGVVGVAPGVRLWGVKVLGANGSGKVSDVICGLNWVIAQKKSNTTDFAVVNMSLSGDGGDGPCDGSDNFHGAVCNTVGAEIPVVVAAGNGGESAARTVPATWKETIAVSAFADLDGKPGGRFKRNRCGDRDDTFADFSNFGSDVDIAAPGVCVVSTLSGGGYGRNSGTSMAAPHVAGAVALFKATNPNATPDDVRAWLLSSAASRGQRSDVGFTGDPDGTRERVLYLGSPGGEGVVAAANDDVARDASEPGATDADGQPADVTVVEEPTDTGRTGTSRERRTGDRADPSQEREREHRSQADEDGGEDRP